MNDKLQQAAEEIATKWFPTEKEVYPNAFTNLKECITTNPTLLAMQEERDAAVEQAIEWKARYMVEQSRETCTQCGMSWNPSLVESGHCIFCIQKQTKSERTTLKAKVAELEKDKEMLKTQMFKANELLHQVTRLSTAQGVDAAQCGLVVMTMDYFEEQRTAIQNAIQKESGE